MKAPAGISLPGRGQEGFRLQAVAVLGVLFLIIVWRVSSSWCYFDRFLDDDGWYLCVAQRVAQGELLYRDVGWAYGPLPVYALSLLFRWSPSVVWAQLLDIMLSASAVFALYVAGRSVVGRRTSLAVTSWAALLGSSVGLISHQLDAYTSALAWGSSTSLAATASACAWVQRRSLSALLSTCLFTILALLSKPEFGLAALSVLATAVCLGRPSKLFGLWAIGLAVGALLFIAVLGDPETLAASWRGYSGYDLIAAGSVTVVAFHRLFGTLVVAGIVGAILWWATRIRSFAVMAGLLASLLIILRAAEGDRFLHAASIIAQVSWIGVAPALAWAGWRVRKSSMPPGFWILWVYSITVGLRWFLVGDFRAVAAGPAGLIICLLVSRGVLHRPTPAGWILLAAFLLFSSFESELQSLRKPTSLQPVNTTLGTVRLPDRQARNIQVMQEAIDKAQAGGLFVWGPGPGWYFVCDRPNPTRFDVLIAGLGTTEPEVTQLLDDLHAHPPALVLTHRNARAEGNLTLEMIWSAMGASGTALATTPDGRWTLHGVGRVNPGGIPRTSSQPR